MSKPYDEFASRDSNEENDDDDEIGALGSILSWDEDEDGGVGATSTNAALSDRETMQSTTLPDLVSFNMKGDGITSAYLQHFATVPLNHTASATDPSPSPIGAYQSQISYSEGQSTVTQQQVEQKIEVASTRPQAPLTPATAAQTQLQQQYQQQQQLQQQQLNMINAQAVAQQTRQAQPQQACLPAAAPATQPHQVVQQAAVASNLAASQPGAFALFQQNALLAQGKQQQAVGIAPTVTTMVMPNMAQAQTTDQRTDQQHAQFAIADPNAFLRQLQVAQLQQQFNAAAVQQTRPIAQQVIATGPQATQVSAALQQMQFQTQLPIVSSVQVAPPSRQAAASKKASSQKKPPQTTSAPKQTRDLAAANKASIVSASDTDGEISAKVGSAATTIASKKSAASMSKKSDLDTSHMSAEEKAKANRDRNREHARNTRLRKKAYLEKLKTTVDELCKERDTLVSERAGAANILVEMHNTRTEVLMSFFALRSANEKRRELWASILDESSFQCVLPVTPYRSFPASEVQVSKCQRTILGIDGMMADTASLHVLLNSLVDRSRFPNGTIVFQYTLVTEEAVIAGNQIMARWVMSTLNATQCGARMEVGKQGMLCCRFNSAHKITGVELMFDVMALMLQLKQAAGSETFSVIPNTVQTCQRSFDKPMVMTLADEPYTIVQVNKLWEEMTGYKAEEVVGKTSCRILEGEETDPTAVEVLMNEIRFKRPASAMIINCKKIGERFRNFFLAYPLSTDSRITHYLRLSTHVDTVGEAKSSAPQIKQSVSYAASGETPGNVMVPTTADGNRQTVLQPKFYGGGPVSKAGVAANQATAAGAQPLQQPLQQPVQQPLQQPVYSIAPVLSEAMPASSATGGMILPPALGVKNMGVQQFPVSNLKRPNPSGNGSVAKQQKLSNSVDSGATNGNSK
mmetsp:Transcript_8498/g.20450  ORF Transcript_8498/g.20450 Transcript_8498/m.20450 type:complete len:917 (+) Transcript_8498:92-2842(+)